MGRTQLLLQLSGEKGENTAELQAQARQVIADHNSLRGEATATGIPVMRTTCRPVHCGHGKGLPTELSAWACRLHPT